MDKTHLLLTQKRLELLHVHVRIELSQTGQNPLFQLRGLIPHELEIDCPAFNDRVQDRFHVWLGHMPLIGLLAHRKELMADQLDEIGMPGRDLIDAVNRVQVKSKYAFHRFDDQVACV